MEIRGSSARIVWYAVSLLFIFIIFLFIVVLKYYPIVIVNNHLISARSFYKNYNAAIFYYNRQVSNNSSTIRLSSADIEATVLTGLVESGLIDDEVKNETGNDFDYLVRNKIARYQSDVELQKAAVVLYGVNFDDFKNEILIPQAERDILAGRLFLKGKNMNDWLKDAKKSAHVIIFSRSFKWDGEKIIQK